MASIQKFEDLICWKKARELANFIFDITDKQEFRDFDLKRQIRRASISPLSNIAEGFDRGTRAEFVDALFIAIILLMRNLKKDLRLPMNVRV
jgi:hypothetical protein